MSAPDTPSTTEAAAILGLVSGDFAAAVRLVQQQFDVLYARAQSLIQLAGIVVTVTGFSGRLIAGTNTTAQVFIILGLATVVASACWMFLRVLKIRWVTSDLEGEAKASLSTMIDRRNQKTQAISVGGTILFVGLALYVVSITIMLANPEPLDVPVR